MDERISTLNTVQLNSKKPFVDNEIAHFEWEDTGLLSLLIDGQPCLHYRYFPDRDLQDEENDAVKIANRFIRAHAADKDLAKLEAAFSESINSSHGYLRERLCEIEAQVVKNAKTLKGLLIYGEGGIGKTRFLYEFCRGLEAKNRPFLGCFNQGAFVKLKNIGSQAFKNLVQDGCTLIMALLDQD